MGNAFDQLTHYLVTAESCARSGLPEDFCRRVGVASRDVDAKEFWDLAAHAQSEGTELCGAANAVARRLHELGAKFFANLSVAKEALGDPTGEKATNASVGMGVTLGMALHTLQDNCAHQGMTNAQHAWLTRSDMCQGTNLDPDDAPELKACAVEVTDAVMAVVASHIKEAQVLEMVGQVSCQDVGWVGPCSEDATVSAEDACAFLAMAVTWDGVDRRWDVSVVAPHLEAAFLEGSAEDMCSVAGPVVASQDALDVSGGPPTCSEYHVLCMGYGSSPNGWSCLGCAGARPRGFLGTSLVLLILLGVLRRRSPVSGLAAVGQARRPTDRSSLNVDSL